MGKRRFYRYVIKLRATAFGSVLGGTLWLEADSSDRGKPSVRLLATLPSHMNAWVALTRWDRDMNHDGCVQRGRGSTHETWWFNVQVSGVCGYSSVAAGVLEMTSILPSVST